MKRRKVIGLLGLTAAGAVSTVGSGAFTSTSAARQVALNTAPDENAFLQLKEGGQGQRSGGEDEIRFDIPSFQEQNLDGTNPQNPQGVGTDSVYRFARDVEGRGESLFSVRNQGTDDVRIWGTQEETTDESGNELPKVSIFNTETGQILDESNRSKPISPGGEQIPCGLVIDTRGVEVRPDNRYVLDITIHAAVEGQ